MVSYQLIFGSNANASSGSDFNADAGAGSCFGAASGAAGNRATHAFQ
jgi:hypothetical protein